jgi:hypothetical protein
MQHAHCRPGAPCGAPGPLPGACGDVTAVLIRFMITAREPARYHPVPEPRPHARAQPCRGVRAGRPSAERERHRRIVLTRTGSRNAFPNRHHHISQPARMADAPDRTALASGARNRLRSSSSRRHQWLASSGPRVRQNRARHCAARTCSTDKSAGSHRSRRCGCQSADRNSSGNRSRHVRSSDKRCNGAHPDDMVPRWPVSGRRQCRPCKPPQCAVTGSVGGKAMIDKNFAQEEHGTRLAVQHQRVLASPAQAAAGGELGLQHRCRVGEHAMAERAHRPSQARLADF